MLFAKPDYSVGVIVRPKCGTTTMRRAMDDGRVVLAKCVSEVPRWYAVVRHPVDRLESFVRDKGIREPRIGGAAELECQVKLRKCLSDGGKRRLSTGDLELRDVVDAILSGYMDEHIEPLCDLIPECALILKLEEPDTFERLSSEFGFAFGHENSTRDVPFTKKRDPSTMAAIRYLYRHDYKRFCYE